MAVGELFLSYKHLSPTDRLVDLHSSNVCFSALDVNGLSETQILSHLSAPIITSVTSRAGEAMSPLLPKYIVKPSPFTLVGDDIKIIDFSSGTVHLFHEHTRSNLIWSSFNHADFS